MGQNQHFAVGDVSLKEPWNGTGAHCGLAGSRVYHSEQTLVERSQLAHKALRVEETCLREVCHRVAIAHLTETKVVTPNACVVDERDAKERLGVEDTNGGDRPIMLFAGTILLIADIATPTRAPPDFARMTEGAFGAGMDRLFKSLCIDMALKVTQSTGRHRRAMTNSMIARAAVVPRFSDDELSTSTACSTNVLMLLVYHLVSPCYSRLTFMTW